MNGAGRTEGGGYAGKSGCDGHAGADPREENLYETLVGAILGNSLRPGERLNEQLLSEAHGMSRTRIRRVLVRLQHEHIVRFEHNRGAFVCRPTVKEARDLFETRLCLEEGVVRILCRKVREDGGLDPAVISQLHEAAGARIPSNRGGEAGLFHLRLAEATGNQELMELIAGLVRRCALLQAVYGTSRRQGEFEEQHKALVERVGAGDEAKAVALIQAHLDDLVAELELDQKDGAPDIYAPR